MPETNKNHPIIDELAEYLQLSRVEVLEKVDKMKQQLHNDWFQLNPSNLSEITKFYQENPLHIYNVLDFNTWSDAQLPKINFKQYNIKTALDFGSGCGTTAIHLFKQGIQTDIADINPSLLNFAIWRLKKRGFNTNSVSLNDLKPIKKNYDLILTIDVLEHLINPLEMMCHFREKAKYFYSTALKPKKISQHINMFPQEKVIDILKTIGWKPIWLSQNNDRGFFKNG